VHFLPVSAFQGGRPSLAPVGHGSPSLAPRVLWRAYSELSIGSKDVFREQRHRTPALRRQRSHVRIVSGAPVSSYFAGRKRTFRLSRMPEIALQEMPRGFEPSLLACRQPDERSGIRALAAIAPESRQSLWRGCAGATRSALVIPFRDFRCELLQCLLDFDVPASTSKAAHHARPLHHEGYAIQQLTTGGSWSCAACQ
jgi:hypothetical protein